MVDFLAQNLVKGDEPWELEFLPEIIYVLCGLNKDTHHYVIYKHCILIFQCSPQHRGLSTLPLRKYAPGESGFARTGCVGSGKPTVGSSGSQSQYHDEATVLIHAESFLWL